MTISKCNSSSCLIHRYRALVRKYGETNPHMTEVLSNIIEALISTELVIDKYLVNKKKHVDEAYSILVDDSEQPKELVSKLLPDLLSLSKYEDLVHSGEELPCALYDASEELFDTWMLMCSYLDKFQ